LLAAAPADAHAGHHCGPEGHKRVDAVQPPQPGNRVGEDTKRHLEHSYPEHDQCPPDATRHLGKNELIKKSSEIAEMTKMPPVAFQDNPV
jgi:hypothetical protein